MDNLHSNLLVLAPGMWAHFNEMILCCFLQHIQIEMSSEWDLTLRGLG